MIRITECVAYATAALGSYYALFDMWFLFVVYYMYL